MSTSRTPVAPEASAGGARTDVTVPGPARGIQFAFPDTPPARYRLLWNEAPQTCTAVLAALPSAAECFHAIYSGTVSAFLLDPEVTAPVENATTCLIPGDLIFTHYDPGRRHGHLNALSEIYWPYDRYARPTIPGQFIPLDSANVFGEFDGDTETWKAFAARCLRLRFDGTAQMQIETYP
jgi:hypothetical protein